MIVAPIGACERSPGSARDTAIDTSQLVVLARFSVTSIIGTVIDFSLLWLLVSVAGLGVVPAKLLATEGSILNSFFWHERWTFAGHSAQGGLLRRIVSFNGAFLGSLLLSLAVVAVCVGVWGQHIYLLANALTLPVNFLWTYAVSNWVIWRRAAAQGASGVPPVPDIDDAL